MGMRVCNGYAGLQRVRRFAMGVFVYGSQRVRGFATGDSLRNGFAGSQRVRRCLMGV